MASDFFIRTRWSWSGCATESRSDPSENSDPQPQYINPDPQLWNTLRVTLYIYCALLLLYDVSYMGWEWALRPRNRELTLSIFGGGGKLSHATRDIYYAKYYDGGVWGRGNGHRENKLNKDLEKKISKGKGKNEKIA